MLNKSGSHASSARTYRRLVTALALSSLLVIQLLQLVPRFSRTAHAAGDISLNALGVTVSQDFDTLATSGTANPWTDGTTLTGWYSQFELQTSNPTTYRADSGGSNAGAIYSWGVAGAHVLTERAFGSVSSGTPGTIYNAVKITNNTGTTINSLGISFNGEQWRQGGCTGVGCTPAAQKIDFQYQVASAGTITDANTPTTGWLDHDTLDFTSPQPGPAGTGAGIDGNAAANRTALASTINVTINNGQEIWLRWRDINDLNNDHGLAIDDFSVTPLGGSIGPNGVRTTDVQGTDDGGFAMALQADGKIVVGGYAVDPVNLDKEFAVVRYNYNGTLDTTFGGTGKVVTDFNATSDRIWGITIQSDNKIVAVGETFNSVNSTNDVAMARYNPDGTLDLTFGTLGRVTTDYLAGNNSAYGVAMSGTNIYVAGAATVGGNYDFMVARYNTLGLLDATFNPTGTPPGIATTGFGGGNDIARGVAVDSSSRPVLGGYSNGGSNDDFAIARFDTAGALDATFVGSSRVDLQACKLEYSIVSPK